MRSPVIVFSHCCLVVGCILLLVGGCGEEGRNPSESSGFSLPSHVSELDSLTIIPPDVQPPDTAELELVRIYRSNEESFIPGNIAGVKVDNVGRLFVLASSMGSSGVFVLDREGNLIDRIGRQGDGPGEFAYIRSMQLKGDSLFLYDAAHFKYMVFSTEDFSLLREELVDRSLLGESDSLARRLKARDLYVTSNSSKLIRFWDIPQREESDINTFLYYRLADDGVVKPGMVLEQPRFEMYFTHGQRPAPPRAMSFTRHSLIAVSENGPIYTAWTGDFLIKVRDASGVYRRAFYFPYRNRPLDITDPNMDEGRRETWLEGNRHKVPETWPALHRMEVDEQSRLWVSTITESDSTFKWWVLDKNGEVLARFDWPGERWSRSVGFLPDMEIRNSHIYTISFNYDRRLYEISKFRVIFKPHPHNRQAR